MNLEQFGFNKMKNQAPLRNSAGVPHRVLINMSRIDVAPPSITHTLILIMRGIGVVSV